MQIDRESKTPAYRQIMEHFRGQILRHELPAGYRLPPERKLAAALGVNRSTVVTAYRELAAAGLVESRTGSGTAVARRSGGEPDWAAYLEAGQFLPDSALRTEVLAARQAPGSLSLADGEPSPDCRPDLGPLLHSAPADLPLGYPELCGYAPLREQIAALMSRAGEDASPENILILGGAQQGFHLVSQCLLEPGDGAATEQFSYVHSLGVFTSAGVRLFSVPAGEHGLPASGLADLLTRRSLRLLLTGPTFANPTGATLPEEQRSALLDLCRRHQLPVLEDDPYRGLHFRAPSPHSLKALDTSGLVLYLGSFSKSLAPGLRVGWLTAPAPVVERLARAKWHMDHGSSLLPQWLVAEWLRRGLHEPHLERLRLELARRCEALEESLRRFLPGVASWRPPAGGFHLWCRFDLPCTSVALFRAAARAGVATMPAALYGRESADGPLLRLSFCALPPEQVKDAVRRLATATRTLRTTGG